MLDTVGASLIGNWDVCEMRRNWGWAQVFDEIPVRDVAYWNSMISGYMNDGEFYKGLDLF